MTDRKDGRPIDPWTSEPQTRPSEQNAEHLSLDLDLDNLPPHSKEQRMTDNNVDNKTWKLLEKAVLASVSEQRRSRRWGCR